MKAICFQAAFSALMVGCSGTDGADDVETGRFNGAIAPQANIAAAPVDAADVMLPPYDPNSVPGMSRYKNRSYVLSGAVWGTNVIPVCWDDIGEDERPESAWVSDAVKKSWEAQSAVRFIGWKQCAPNAKGIRIRVADEGPHTKGLGKQLADKPAGMVLNRVFANWSQSCAQPSERERCIRSIAVHEFGHALAFAHEHNRPDTPGECTKKKQGSNGDLMLTPWDRDSVMNYCNPVYANAGILSKLDAETVRYFYK